MNDLKELVDLPDPAVQPLVHPLDLPDARRPFLASWLIATWSGPAVALCLAAILWFASGSVIPPLIAFAVVAGFGTLASRVYRDRAWAFIPRRRQDHGRSLPVAWELGSALVLAVLLAIALLLLTRRLGQADIAEGVREVTFGMAVATGLLVLADCVRGLRTDRAAALRALAPAVAVLGVAAVAYGVLFGPSGPDSVATVVWAGIAMLVVGTAVAAWQAVDRRRAAS